MSQLLVLTRPRANAPKEGMGQVFCQTEDRALVEAAKLALGASDDDAVFTVNSPSGDPFEVWFDALPFDAERTNRLIDACASSFAALALFYGDANDLERTRDLDELKDIIHRQFGGTPVELYAVWAE